MSKKIPPLNLGPIDFEGMRSAAANVAAAHNVPTHVYPQADTKVREGEGAEVVTLNATKPMHALVSPLAPTPRTRPMALKIPLTESLRDWLAQQARHADSCMQYIALVALQQAGAPVDLTKVPKDGRRVR